MQLCPYCGRYRNIKGANGKWGCGACEVGRAHVAGNSIPVDKQVSSDLMVSIAEMIIAIVGFVLKLLVIAFRYLFRGLAPSSPKSRHSARRPSSGNAAGRVITDYERSQRQKYETEAESKERELEHSLRLLEEAHKKGEVESFEYKNGKYSVKYKKSQS